MKKITLLLITFLLLGFAKLDAQDYKTSLGLRIGPYYGVSFKHFIRDSRAIEAILVTRRRGVGITGLYEIHTPAFAVKRLQAYGGIGGHVNVFNRYDSDYWDWDDDKRNNGNGNGRGGIDLGDNNLLNLGLDMILGLEYTFTGLPFNISLDWKPSINLIGNYGLSAEQFALSFRFVFK